MLIDSEKLLKRINEDKEVMLENMPNYDYRKGFLSCITFIDKDIQIEALQTELEKIKFDFKSKVKLTVLQHEILKKAYDGGFRWIAKDMDKGVCIYTNEPERREECFTVDDLVDDYDCIPLWLETFNDVITWESGAVEIIDLLNNCEVID